MNGARTLVLLLLLATAAGIGLVVLRPQPDLPDETPPGEAPDLALLVEKSLGLSFKTPPVVEITPEEDLLARIGEFLDERFGPGGLTFRSRAFELLGLLPPGGNLRGEFLAMEAAGTRGWFDERDGVIVVRDDFDETGIHDQVALAGLLARALLHQHTPPTIGRLSDDAWLARRGVHGALAARVESELRRANPAAFDLPTSAQTEREAVLLGLPIYLHNIAQFHLFQARDHVEAVTKADPRALAALATDPPLTTVRLLGGPPGPPPPISLPKIEQVLFEEPVGALGAEILLEWLADFDRAASLAAQWRGDRLQLFANGGGDHLLWVCRWATPEAAREAAAILQPPAEEDRPGRRFRSLTVDGVYTIFGNCTDAETAARDIPVSLSK